MEVLEPPTPNNEDENDDVFFNALDEFPFFDESNQSTSLHQQNVGSTLATSSFNGQFNVFLFLNLLY